MTSSMVSARLLTDLITGQENPDSAVFSPQRRITELLCRNLSKTDYTRLPGWERGSFPHPGRKYAHTWAAAWNGTRMRRCWNAYAMAHVLRKTARL